MPSFFVNLHDWKGLRVDGPDAHDFLQRLSTADIRLLKMGKTVPALFLTGRANPIALSYPQRDENGFLLVVPWGFRDRLFEHLEKFHFSENLTLSKLELFVFLSDGVDSKALWSFEDPQLGNLTYQAFVAPPKLSGQERSIEFYERLRITHLVPKIGTDLSDKEIVSEAPFEWAIAHNKGCYPGQEVVERIETYGKVQRRLRLVEIEGTLSSLEFFVADRKAMELKSHFQVEGNPMTWLGIANVTRSAIDADAVMSNSTAKARIYK